MIWLFFLNLGQKNCFNFWFVREKWTTIRHKVSWRQKSLETWQSSWIRNVPYILPWILGTRWFDGIFHHDICEVSICIVGVEMTTTAHHSMATTVGIGNRMAILTRHRLHLWRVNLGILNDTVFGSQYLV